MSRKSGSALRAQIHEQIRKLPADVDPVVAADVALEILVDSAWLFSRDCKRLPPTVMRELLRRRPKDATHVYLTLAVDPDEPDAALAKSWARAIQGLADLEIINSWHSPQKRAKFAALADNEHLLHAIRGASANGDNVSNNMLAVLVADGSDESIDALVPHLEPIGDRLDAMRMLRVHAKTTPRLTTMFAQLDHEAEQAGSPAQRIARLVGLPNEKLFWFKASINSTSLDGIPAVQVHVIVDSRRAAWFEVSVAKIARGTLAGYTSFTHDQVHDDPLGLGRCDASDVPAWLVKVAKKLRVTWDTPLISSSVRGSKRTQISEWLLPG